MDCSSHTTKTIIDFITGRSIPNVGAEANRQQVEKQLVENKGYEREEIQVDASITLNMETGQYLSKVDLVVSVHGRRYMVIKCAPGSLASREREVISAARLLDSYQIPLAIASDGRTALVWDTLTGRKLGEGWDAVPTKAQSRKDFDPTTLVPLAMERRTRQQLIFRSYDSMNINH